LKSAIILGIILIGLGILALAYFASPVGLLLQSTVEQHEIDTMPPIAGGIALVSGIALLLAVRPRRPEKK
jgi:hypothetical protein